MPDPSPARPAVRCEWSEVRRYWESHAQWSTLDRKRDPDGLDNVCHTGAPQLVNRYYHRGQRLAFLSLLDALPPPAGSATALDVGCGTARWSRLLSDRGYEVTGIDLQGGVIADNARRHPEIRFEVTAIQDYVSGRPFDLVCSVTVLQHLPQDEQVRAIAALARLLRPGGHAIVLENTSDWRSPIVFANTLVQWTERFAAAEMTLVRSRRYDYSPTLRTYYAITRPIRMRGLPVRGGDLPDPEPAHAASAGRRSGWAMRADRAAKVLASCVDSAVDPLLFAARAALPAGHVAALLRRH